MRTSRRHPPQQRQHLITLGRMAPLTSMLTLACRRCDRRSWLSVARLLEEWGQHAALADVAAEHSADCEWRWAHSIYDRCGVNWPELPALVG